MIIAKTGSALTAAIAVMLAATPLHAQDVSIEVAIKDHRFQPAEIKAPAGRTIVLVVRNLDPTPEEFESKTLRVERVIAGNSEARIQLRALQPGRYRFFGEFHEKTAQGAVVVE